MSKRLPLVLDDSANVQRLQSQDWIDPQKARLAASVDFNDLRRKFRLLLYVLHGQGINLPEELISEIEVMENHYAK